MGDSRHVVSVCVFCASSDTTRDIYKKIARELGREMAARGMRLVYGGGNNGLMGVLSEHVHDNGGHVLGVITGHFIDLGYAYKEADELICVDTIRERQAIMEDSADAFIGMAGGFGTLEEILEIITFKQLGLNNKPVVLLNSDGFFNGLLDQFDICFREKIIPEHCRDIYYIADTVSDALDYIEHCRVGG